MKTLELGSNESGRTSICLQSNRICKQICLPATTLVPDFRAEMNPVVANENDHNAENVPAYRMMEGACKGTQVHVSEEKIYSNEKSYDITLYLRLVDVRHGYRGTA